MDIVQHTKPLYEYGRLKVQTEYGTLPVYDRERTVCDCLKRQDELGMDVVAEIIRSYIRGPKNLQKLYTTAERLHVRKRLTPYVEVLV